MTMFARPRSMVAPKPKVLNRNFGQVATQAPAAIPKPPMPAVPSGAFTPDSLMNQYASAYDSAKTTNEFRYGDILKQYDALKTGGGEALNNFANQQLGSYQAANAPILQGYEDRYTRNMKDLEGAGLQESADIAEAWESQQANAQQDLTARGLGGTTVMPTMKAGITRQANADQGRLKDRLRQQRVDTDARLSGDTLGAKTAYTQNYADLAKKFGDQNFAFQTGTTQDAINFQERREDAYPDFGTYAQLAMKLGEGGAGAPPGSASNGAGGGGAPVGTPIGGPGGAGGTGGMRSSAPYMNVLPGMASMGSTAGGNVVDVNIPGVGKYKGNVSDMPAHIRKAYDNYRMLGTTNPWATK